MATLGAESAVYDCLVFVTHSRAVNHVYCTLCPTNETDVGRYSFDVHEPILKKFIRQGGSVA